MTNEQTLVLIDVLTNDSDAEGDSLAIVAIDAAFGLVEDLGNGILAFDPSGLWNDLHAGETDSYSFTYTIADGPDGPARRSSTEVTVTIVGLDDLFTPETDIVDFDAVGAAD